MIGKIVAWIRWYEFELILGGGLLSVFAYLWWLGK